VKWLQVDQKVAERYGLEPGDLLACRFNGNLKYVGRFALFRGYLGEQRLYPDKLIRFRIDKNKVLPEYVRFAMNSPERRVVIEAFCTTTAGNIGISAGNLKTVLVPIPPLAEQRHIVAYLDNLQMKVDALKRLQAETATELEALLPSVLDRAFKGEL
jgi:type I restriction enzyme S subunit